MNIIVTGSLGHISKPLTEKLVGQGHEVTVVSRDPEKQNAIEALGAKAAIGNMEDVAFLTETFTGADVVYCMEAPGRFFDPDFDLMAEIDKLGRNYAQAVERSGVKRVVHLSSIGAHTDKGNGILAFHYNIEQILGALPADIAITFMRPVGFYYNLFAFIPAIKNQGVIACNYGEDDKEPWVSPFDIADAIAEEIGVQQPGERKVRYVASDELTCNEVATILGRAIGKPDMKWVLISDEQMLAGMLTTGMNPVIAKGLVEMNAARRNGVLYQDYLRHKPALGKVKMKDFAPEFARVYRQSN
ncbi:MAG TPA: NAD(P)H-binding protein [Mucilaginibacter sp.]|nr:NAD(P)H-binding protein [Mucilaginibacter sp.]